MARVPWGRKSLIPAPSPDSEKSLSAQRRSVFRRLLGKIKVVASSAQVGMQFLMEAAKAYEQPCTIDTATSWGQAIEQLARPGRGTDLVITHWGHGGEVDRGGRRCAVAERLLSEIRHQDVRVPVIVFASGDRANENRVAALKLGALAFVFRWETLFREVARVFEQGADAG